MVSLCFLIANLLSQPFREEKQSSPKKLILLYFLLRHWENHVPFSGSWFMLIFREMKLADSLANEARAIEPVPLCTIVFDVSAVTKQKLCKNLWRKFSLPELNYSHEIMTTIARLRTKHFKGMKQRPNSSRIYVECKHCLGTQLDSKHLFCHLSIDHTLFKIDINCNIDSL